MGIHEHHLYTLLSHEYILLSSSEVKLHKKHTLQYKCKSRKKPGKEPQVGQAKSRGLASPTVEFCLAKRVYIKKIEGVNEDYLGAPMGQHTPKCNPFNNVSDKGAGEAHLGASFNSLIYY